MTSLSGLDQFRNGRATEVGAVTVGRSLAARRSSVALSAGQANRLDGALPAQDDPLLSIMVRDLERGRPADRLVAG